jgi:hypothetical protein
MRVNHMQQQTRHRTLFTIVASRGQVAELGSLSEGFALTRRLFTSPTEPTSPREAISWWEQRRLPYNLIVGTTAIVSFAVYCLAIKSTGVLKPGEDIIEPVAIMAAPLAVALVNICYTAGWLVDAPLRAVFPSLSSRLTVWLFAVGLAFSIVLVSLPALFWSGYRLLQLIHVVA